jgi:hypothetical protein
MLKRTATRRTPQPLEALPMASEEVWEGGSGPLTAQVREEEGGPFHPELALWVLAGEGPALGYELAKPGAGPDALIKLLHEVMRRPAVGRSRRPGKVRVQDPALADQLRELLAPLEVAVEQSELLNDWRAAFDATDAAMAPGSGYHPTTEDHAAVLAELFRAAAAFHRAQPWRLLDEQRPMGLDLLGLGEPTLGLTVMGAGGENEGLVLYPSIQVLMEFYDAVRQMDLAALDREACPAALCLSFSSSQEMPDEAVKEQQARGWELDAPDAFPLLLATEPGEGCTIDLSPRSLMLMIIALRAVTRFAEEAEADLRRGEPRVVRDMEIGVVGAPLPIRISCPPVSTDPPRRSRRSSGGPRRR